MQVTYYIKHPNGREKIRNNPQTDAEAIEAFNKHWTATASWVGSKKRVLVKEVKEEIIIEE